MHTHADRLAGLDLLRALAISSVMLYHVSSYGPRLPAWVEFGWMGVDLFFVLSCFLIDWQILQPYTQGQTPCWGWCVPISANGCRKRMGSDWLPT